MLLGIDHVILAVADLERAAAELERALGLRVGDGGRHEAHGTHNRLVWLGDSYVELMGVFDDRLAAGSWWGRVALEVIARGGGLMGVPLATDDAAADAARLRAMGSALHEPLRGERARPDGEIVRWQLARLPEPLAGIGLVFLIEHDTNAAEWRSAERAARAQDVHPLGTIARLVRVEAPVSDVRGATRALLFGLGLQFRPSLAGSGARDASIGAHVLRLVAGPPTSAASIVIRGGVTERSAELLGCRWQLLPA